jgi:hypothetical protein
MHDPANELPRTLSRDCPKKGYEQRSKRAFRLCRVAKMGRKVSLRCSVRLQGRLLRPFSDSLKTKFAQSIIQEHGRSLFDGAPPAETRAHRSDGQCQRIRLRQPLHPATTCSTPMPRRRRFGIESTAYLLLTKPSTRTSWECRFYRFCRKNREPTSGLEPLTCSLRVIGHVLQGCAGDCKCRIFKRFPFSGLLSVAPYCVPGGIRVVSTQPFLRAVGEADTASISPMRSVPVRSRGSLSSSTRDPANRH